jgi:hypothetical protein
MAFTVTGAVRGDIGVVTDCHTGKATEAQLPP